MAPGALAEHKTSAGGGRVHAGGGTQSGHTEAARRSTDAGHPDGVGSLDSTGAASGIATAVRSRVLRVELRLPSRTQRAASGEGRAELRCRRQTVGGGYRSGEVLRPSEPRRADGTGGAAGEGQTGGEADPALFGSGTDGRRGGECAG